MKRLTRFTYMYLKENKKVLFKLICVFIIGICIGVYFINNLEPDSESKISEYILNSIKSTKENNIDRMQMLIQLFKNNFLFLCIIFFLGCMIIGGPIIYGANLYKGISLGYTLAAIIAVLGPQKGTIYLVVGMLLQNLFVIISVFLLSVSGLKLCNGTLKDFSKFRNLKTDIIKHLVFFGISSIFMIIAILIQVYISTNLVRIFQNFI